jgi:hypothetical protein
MTPIPEPTPRKMVFDGVRESVLGILGGLAISAVLFPALFRPAQTDSPASIQWTAPADPVITVRALPPAAQTPVPPAARFADFGNEMPSSDARHIADWVADSGDSANTDFVIVDKKDAKVYVFDSTSRLRGSTPVLLGSARGDDTVPGIGARPIAQVRPHERTTPAGRFVAERGRNTLGEDIVWVDYDASVSMHRVRTINPIERRLERLASLTIADNRISYGCINVPKAFFESHIQPIFATRRAVVYVLPEVKPVRQVFGSYDVATAHAGATSESAVNR